MQAEGAQGPAGWLVTGNRSVVLVVNSAFGDAVIVSTLEDDFTITVSELNLELTRVAINHALRSLRERHRVRLDHLTVVDLIRIRIEDLDQHIGFSRNQAARAVKLEGRKQIHTGSVVDVTAHRAQ